MKKFIYLLILFFSLETIIFAQSNIMILKLSYGTVEIELYPDKAPNHVKRFKELADSGKYDGVVFHRVIDGFMAQSGDVKYGNSLNPDFNISLAGTGGSDLPNLKQNFPILHTQEVYCQLQDLAIQIALTVNFLFVSTQHHI